MIIQEIKNNYHTFPQADDIYKVLGYCNLVSQNKLDQYFDSFKLWDYSNRQAQYYIDAARYLGLYHPKEKRLSEQGDLLFLLGKDQLLRAVSILILRNRAFNTYYKTNDKTQTIEFLISEFELSESTSYRRFQTIKCWVDWARMILKDEEITYIDDEQLL